MPKEIVSDVVNSLTRAGYEKGVRYPVPVSITEPQVVPDAWIILNNNLKRKIL